MLINQVQSFVKLLHVNKIHYCIIGGVAVLLHGGRASTVDFDFYILSGDSEKLLKMCKNKKIKIEKLGEYQMRAFYGELRVDILIADPLLGATVIKRANKVILGKTKVSIATPEDLVVMKTLSDRPIDRRDIEEIKEIFGKKLNKNYIKKQLTRFS